MIPMFPLESSPLPGEVLPLRIFEPRYSQLVSDCLTMPDPSFGVVLITQGREVGGGDTRSSVGALAHITECVDEGDGRYSLRAVIGGRIRVRDWLPDDPYPRASIDVWPDEPGPEVGAEKIGHVVDLILALYQRVADAQGRRLRSDALAVDAAVAEDPALHLYALAARVPLGQADRHAVLAAPTLSERVDVLIDAIETVAAMVEFQLSED